MPARAVTDVRMSGRAEATRGLLLVPLSRAWMGDET